MTTKLRAPDFFSGPMGLVVPIEPGDRVGIAAGAAAGGRVFFFTVRRVSPYRVWLDTGVRVDRRRIVVWSPSGEAR